MPQEEKRSRADRMQIAEQLEAYIVQQRLAPHTRLPSEQTLSEAFDCHRNTLRAALRYLESVGKLYGKKNSGSYVAPPKLRRDLSDFEPLWYFAEKNSYQFTTQVLEFAAIDPPKTVASRLKLQHGKQAYSLTRIRCLDGVPAIFEVTYLSAARFARLHQYDFAVESLFEILATEYSTLAVDGSQRVDIVYADAVESRLLQVPIGQPLFSLAGVTLDDCGIPIEVFRSALRSDLVGFCTHLQLAGPNNAPTADGKKLV